MEARRSRDLYEIPQRSREVHQLHETRENGVTSVLSLEIETFDFEM